MSDDASRADELRRRVEEAVGGIFEVEAEIGRGGMAVVYRALDKRLRRRVALKVLPPELAFRTDVRSRFVREAQLAAQLSHANIVPIFGVDDAGGIVYFAMGLVDGETLGKQLARDPRPSVEFVRRVLREVAAGLAYAHQHGVVHRDVKPDNILVERDGGRAQVSDFGIARAAEGDLRLTATGVAVGTPAYMSPEQAMGEKDVDGRADIYALGVVGWQMLAGELPFHSENTPGMLMKHISEAPRPLGTLRRDLPANLVYAIERAMAKGKSDRWVDAEAFRDALDERAEAPAEPFGDGGRALAPKAPRPVLHSEDLAEGYRGGGDPRGPSPVKPWRFEPAREEAAATDSGAHAIRQWREQRKAWREKNHAAPIEHEPLSRRERRDMRRDEREQQRDQKLAGKASRTPEDRIRGVQRNAVSFAMMVVFFGTINAVTSPQFPWFIFPSLGMGIALVSRIGSLWIDGIPLGRLFRRQPVSPPSDLDDAPPLPRAEGSRSKALPRVPAPDLSDVPRDVLEGPHGRAVKESAEAKVLIVDVMAKLPESERLSLPDVQGTAKALDERVRQLAAAMHQLDRDASPDALQRLEKRIADARVSGAPGDESERERRIGLLERQQSTLKDLAERRAAVAQQLESASILIQTMKLDMLKLRASGIESRIADSTMGTQEARAVATDIERVVEAANEVRKL